MRLTGFLIFFLSIISAYSSFAQRQGELTQSRILILLDESSSMIQKWPSGKEKYKAADELILRLIDSIYTVNSQVEFSLRVFGHQYTVEQNNCYDTKNEVPFSKDNRTQMQLRLEDIRPLGVTPLAYALSEAAKHDLVDEAHNAYSIILITDGGESCGGNICDVMRTLMKNKVYFRPYIISLEDVPELKTTYSCMGDYLQVTRDADVPKAVGTIVEAFRPVLKITTSEYKHLQTIAATTPTILKVDIPVIKMTEPAPPKTDTVVKPVKIKVDLPAVRPPAEQIASIYQSAPQPFFIGAPAIKNIKPVAQGVPVEVIVIPGPETVNGITPVRLKEVNIPATVAVKLNTVRTSSLPEVEAPVIISPEKITQLPVMALRPAFINPAIARKIRKVETSELPEVEAPVTITPEKVTRLSVAAVVPMTIVTPTLAKKLRKVGASELPEIEAPVTITPEKVTRLSVAAAVPMTIAAPTLAKKIRKVAASELPEVEAPVVITPEKVTGLKAAPPVLMAVTAPTNTKKIKTVRPSSLPEVEAPVVLTVEKITSATIARPNTLAIAAPARTTLNKVPMSQLPAVVIDTPVTPRKTEKIARLQTVQPRSIMSIFVLDGNSPKQVPLSALPPLKIDLPPTPVVKAGPAPKESGPTTKTPDYKVEVEEARQTTVEVYLTNGKGKFYTTTPQVLLLEPGTGKAVKTFYRTVDASGNPDPQENIPVGSYDVAFTAKRSLMLKNVKIEKDKKNRIVVTVHPSSISFEYIDANKRPIVEFTAIVTERNKAQGRVQSQKCTETLEYEPGNYHIEINTFPPELRNVDIDFDESVIRLAQPGFAKFTNELKARNVTLFRQVGDKFLGFYTLDLNDAVAQHLRIQPGQYQAHFNKGGPGGSSINEKVVTFFIKPAQETIVDLK